MSRPLLILLFVILLPAFFSAADPQEAPSPPPQEKVEKPKLSITSINCSVSIEQDRVNTAWSITIENSEEFSISDVNVTCEPGSGLSCLKPQSKWYDSLNFGEKENKTLQFNVNVTGGLNSLKRGENLTLSFTVKYKDCVITSNTTKVPIVLPELNVNHEGWKVNISSIEKNFSSNNIFLVFGNLIIGKASIGNMIGNISVPINIADRSKLDTLPNLMLCLEGSINHTTFRICRLYTIKTLGLNKTLPYLIVVKGVGRNTEVLVNDRNDYPLLQVPLGNDTLLILLKDMFVPGYNKVKVTITYLKDGEVFIQIGDYPILGGVGTLALLLLAVLFVLAMRARRRVERIPAKWGVEAPEHVELG